MRARARALRRELTKAERIVWYGIRGYRLYGVSFRRQAPIGPYVVDFVSHSRRLVIEIDGGQHYEATQMNRDKRREAFLVAKGYRVLRFNNNDVMSNRYGVLTLIAEVLESAPSLPSPASGGGNPSKWRVARYTAWSAEERR
jgi:very-short-patch-repair endonuclease